MNIRKASGRGGRIRSEASRAEAKTVETASATRAAGSTGSDAGEVRENGTSEERGSVAPLTAELREAIIVARKAWAIALYRLMASGPLAPDGVAIVTGRIDEGSVAEVADLARKYGRDVIFLDFGGTSAECPTNIVVAARARQGVSIHENCELWAFTQRRDRVEILSATRRFKLDEAGHLQSRPNNLDEMRARRVARAHERWRKLATAILAERSSEKEAQSRDSA